MKAAPGNGATLTCEGDPLPTPPGGTLGTFESSDAGLGSRGPVFQATVDGGSATECLLTPKSGSVAPVACQGDLLPHGGVVDNFGFDRLIGASRRRVVAFTTDDNFGSALYHFSTRARARIAGPGVVTPLGGTYLLGDPPFPSIIGKTVVFVSDVELGSRPSAVFSAILRR
jgi:hypothetical protein